MANKKVDTKPTPKTTTTPPKAINKPRPKPEQKPGATEMMREFLKRTNIELFTTELSFKTVSDGSLIIEKPSILARYKDGRR